MKDTFISKKMLITSLLTAFTLVGCSTGPNTNTNRTAYSTEISSDDDIEEEATTGSDVTDYEKNMENTIDVFLSSKKYDEAITAIKETESVIGETAKTQDALSTVYSAKYNDQISTAYSSGDSITVITAYNEAKSNWSVTLSPESIDNYSTSKNDYINMVTDDASKAFGTNKDYESAIKYLQDASVKVKNDSEITTEIDSLINSYKEYKPIKLTSLEYIQKADTIDVGVATGKDAKDAAGNTYDSSTVICRNEFPGSSPDEHYIMYNLNMNYSRITGIVYRTYWSLSSSKELAGANQVVRIYGDDILLYEAPKFTNNMYDPVDFSLDITGVRNLKIIVSGTWLEDTWPNDRHPIACMADVMLQK